MVLAAVIGTAPNVVFHAETDKFYAPDDRCTHDTASLAEDFIEDDIVECPYHTAQSCLRNGRCCPCLPP